MMNNLHDKREKGWFWDTNRVFESGLSSHAILVRLYLAKCADDEGQCFPSASNIAEKCGISRSSVFKALKELEEKGWLVRTPRVLPGKEKALASNMYTLITPDKSTTSKEEVPSPADELGVVHDVDGGSPGDGLGWSNIRTRVVQEVDGEQYPYNNTHRINNRIKSPDGDQVQEIIDHFNEVWKDVFPKGFTLTAKRRKQIRERLKTFSADTIKLAIDNLHRSEFHKGKNDRGWKATIDFLIRSDEQIDTWANNPPMRLPPSKPEGDDPYAEIYL